MTATPYRRDGLHPIIGMQCGPVRHQIKTAAQTATSSFQRRLIIRETGFILPENEKPAFTDILQIMAEDENRNQLILADIAKALQENRFPLVLTERRQHLERLRASLENTVENLIVLHGGMSEKEREQAQQRLAEIPENEPRLLLATGSYIGEGFDEPRLDTLFLAMPVSFKGKLQQYAGRILRPHPGKDEARIYDYVDGHVPMLARMFKKRLRAYRAMEFASR